jgi:hypothetical protein
VDALPPVTSIQLYMFHYQCLGALSSTTATVATKKSCKTPSLSTTYASSGPEITRRQMSTRGDRGVRPGQCRSISTSPFFLRCCPSQGIHTFDHLDGTVNAHCPSIRSDGVEYCLSHIAPLYLHLTSTRPSSSWPPISPLRLVQLILI